MENSIFDFIKQYISLTQEEELIIQNQQIFRSYRRDDILLREGEIAKECFFVLKGAVRAYQFKEDEERNTNFYFENQTIRPISYFTHLPSDYFLACLEDSILVVGSEERNRILIEQIPKLEILVSKLNEDMLVQTTQEFDTFKNLNPEDRYLQLIKDKPELLNRIPLYHLASFLGITPISLSRIRNRISRN